MSSPSAISKKWPRKMRKGGEAEKAPPSFCGEKGEGKAREADDEINISIKRDLSRLVRASMFT